MADVYVLSPSPSSVQSVSAALQAHSLQHHTSIKSLISCFFKKSNSEQDAERATLVVLDDFPNSKDPLDSLCASDKSLILRYFFCHLNLLVVEQHTLDKTTVASLSQAIATVINDTFSKEYSTIVADAMPTMNSLLSKSSGKSNSTEKRLRELLALMNSSINTMDLLSNSEPKHLAKLAHLVGHWAFPSHELSSDDLAYCAFLMLEFALRYIRELAMWSTLPVPSSNELMMFVLIVRDNYQHGNPFHNFRHAVDVMQACFHYLIRLGCLPEFSQFRKNPKEDELATLKNPVGKEASVLLDMVYPLATVRPKVKHLCHTSILSNPLACFSSPLAMTLLNIVTDSSSNLTLKHLIIGSILATDMAEHFEYVDKLQKFKFSTSDPLDDKVKLISSLLIKCADISNVTRPLRVSSQWALVLSREFAEIETLEKKLANKDVDLDVSYDKVPTTVEDVLTTNPTMHKGQLFFIKTFAEGLFKSISELFPELEFTSDIAMENKEYWLVREANLNG
ncbi:uncharacterized protein CXQ87_001039 [Candidozyma duobushaemuli]|uniref:PDEase domain-containing protein n=1 Tax=Candidozyma duobushaemuli TaxID=1231522 RepID=A0A2V1AK73_9ASCO|nr:uncharacterized protein CXQ87_001039 [[Candida] duobushaemulonis]PVH18122.1 hypothetical protein CXQ87_001039 [[Candida] duobushaemulonis]